MNTSARPISDYLEVSSRFRRSVNVEKDYRGALQNGEYIVTPTALEALHRLSEGLEDGSPSRAWTITGPYGVGKSAFAVFLTRLLCSANEQGEQARGRLRQTAPELYLELTNSQVCQDGGKGFLPILVTARRAPAPNCIAEGIISALNSEKISKLTSVGQALGKELKSKLNGSPLDTRWVIVALDRAAQAAREAGYRGLLIVVDELGKLFEYAARYPQKGDVYVLQELAEHVSRSAEFPAVLLGLLHQSFEEYGHHLDIGTRREWSKIQGRFGDVAFLEPADQVIRLVAEAITCKDAAWPPGLKRQIEKTVASAIEIGVVPPGMSAAEFKQTAISAYPLHPVTLVALPYIFRRFAQNERSLFSYLSSMEPLGFQEFVKTRRMEAESPEFVRLADLFDYFTSNFGLGLFRQPQALRWMEAADLLERKDIARHDASLPEDLKQLLRAVVLGSKMGLKSADRPDAVSGLAELAGVTFHDADAGLRLLEEEFNVLEWDAAFKQFDILGDAVPRTQFLSWLRQRVASTYDDAGKAALFSSKGQQWCDLLGDLDCDFAEENKITTREWRYQAVTSSLDNLPMNVKLAADRWQNALAVDEPRGTLIYCYVGPGRDVASVEQDASRFVRAAAKSVNVPATPTLVVLLSDEDGMLGQAIAELAVLEESVSGEDRARFGNLIPAHVERQQELVRSKVEAMIRQRRYVTPFREATEARRLSQMGSELFSRIYKTPITFPFDGFSTARGNAADSCQELTRELLLGTLDYDAVMGKPIKVKNRAIAVLNDGWGIFSQNGKVLTRPKHLAVRNLTTKWDDLLANGERRLRVAEAIQSLCLPPYGANIASAGLVLSAFVAPRVDKLMVVRDGQQCAVSQWLQDGLFKGKYIDLNALRGVDLVSIGEASSEWEVLLDEWEQAESLLVRVQCFERAEPLRERVPVPPVLHWRVVHLEDLAKKAIATLADVERRQNDALSKIESGYERTNLGLVIWGAASLQEMCDRMRSESTLWHDRQIDQLTPHVERARQEIIQGFSDWLVRQSPRDESPDTVGEFKHKMLHLTGANLKKLKLEDQCSLLEKHVIQIVKNVETALEAKQLVRNVRSWLTMHGDAQRSMRVAESRDLLDVGKDLGNKLQGIALRIALPELGEVRTELSEALARIKQAVEKQLKRATRLWNVRLSSIDDVESSLEEIDALVAAFEGCPNDLNDLHLMRRALRLYYEDNKQLSDERLTWREFESLAEDLRKRASDIIGEGDTPWPPSEVFETLASNISKFRKQRSTEWIDSIEQASSGVEAMSASDANRLHERATAPPAVLTEPHTKRLDKVLKQIEKRLDALKLEWLVEKFRELDAPLRKQFLKLVEEL